MTEDTPRRTPRKVSWRIEETVSGVLFVSEFAGEVVQSYPEDRLPSCPSRSMAVMRTEMCCLTLE